MTTNKRSINRLIAIAHAKGIKRVVISPGSRNAPLVIAFDEHPDFHCYNIPDERVAGFFALGMALKLREPVILTCTSGSATLNYAPAIAEAYYLKVPLLVLTADRPPAWIDQNAGQTMRQRNVYANYIKKSYQLVAEATTPTDLWFNDRMVNEAIDYTWYQGDGPVHINIPFEEPLYTLLPTAEGQESVSITKTIVGKGELPMEDLKIMQDSWYQADKVLLLVGQKQANPALDEMLHSMQQLDKVVLITEATSNVKSAITSSSIDRLIAPIVPEDLASLRPHILITLGAAVVSKRIRGLLQKMAPLQHWHIDPNDLYIDTYLSLTHNILLNPVSFFAQLDLSDSNSDYSRQWEKFENRTIKAHTEYLSKTPWSDLKVFDILLKALPAKCILHLSNSTPVRYVQLFDQRQDVLYHANRGVSGIDGCTSTAVGYAAATDEIVTLVTGDIAFFYDSNAFYHHHVPSNLRIILINNEGGNIFRYIPGPSKTNQLEQHFEAHNKHSARGIAEAYHVDYLSAADEKGLRLGLKDIFKTERQRAAILEVFTPRELNAEILKKYFSYLANEE